MSRHIIAINNSYLTSLKPALQEGVHLTGEIKTMFANAVSLRQAAPDEKGVYVFSVLRFSSSLFLPAENTADKPPRPRIPSADHFRCPEPD
ncbi:hypothetical protein EPL59_15715 [Salmonella enterica subsp. enterica serovar Strasbourg]|uniref:Uncharacterized protein n=2 Tax=Salmonella enterica I TaxID=59201 RepID=A0A5V0BDM2_SALEN|nr:hypothetical protein [Salmonella enterica subsp. enterica serovar Teshie]EBS5460677.1 hypothetical protein [Salmonella enterica subsp. enterica serovar Enteritidis]ECA1251920.1 hypothetical protein [Salmonella enterica subsp. enterica serovar Chailey]ECA7542317.1 hypothetical protein [Salmonella enterica subsp. enterica serovar Strasbourg]MKA15230.1 hypothetical protein [Salmonella enterica subsp. enterica]